MKKNNPELIVCDIEGCVMPSDRSSAAPEKLTPLLHYCREAKRNSELPPFVFCTGRQIPYAEAIAQLTGSFFPGFPSIVENGAFLYDIARNEFFRHPVLTRDVIGGLSEVRAMIENLVGEGQAKKELGKEICISLNPYSPQTVEQLFGEMSQKLENWLEIIEITHSKSAVDITPKGINKASGVRFLSEYTGIELTEMLGIGDTRGDLPMLRLVGIPASPQNATEEVKKEVVFVASANEIEGVIEILHRYTNWK